MNGSIPVHPERGLDPHLSFCPRCGGETNAIAIGHIKKAELPNGQLVYAQKGKQSNIMKQLREQNMIGWNERLDWRDLGENERIPDSEVCEKCKTEIEEWADLVKAGGAYMKCSACGCNGVIKPGTELAEAVRKSTGIEPPDPVGVEFDNCSAHGAVLEEESPGA
jgi:hypothetical protein